MRGSKAVAACLKILLAFCDNVQVECPLCTLWTRVHCMEPLWFCVNHCQDYWAWMCCISISGLSARHVFVKTFWVNLPTETPVWVKKQPGRGNKSNLKSQKLLLPLDRFIWNLDSRTGHVTPNPSPLPDFKVSLKCMIDFKPSPADLKLSLSFQPNNDLAKNIY